MAVENDENPDDAAVDNGWTWVAVPPTPPPLPP